MKSPTILVTKISRQANASGFLTLEALIACTLLAMIIPAALSLSWSANRLKASAKDKLLTLASSSNIISFGVTNQASSSATLYYSELGKTACAVEPANLSEGFTDSDIYPNLTLNLVGSSTSVHAASLTARNGFLYEALDSSIQSQPDFFIIDVRTPASPVVISSLNTGPGLAAITVVENYAYLANKSSLSQLQIINISNRASPILVATLKLPLPDASSTAPHASAIFYNKGLIYLGTEKWNGDEFNIIDVSNPLSPIYLGGFETGTLINDIYVNDRYAYVADSDVKQMRMLDVSDPAHISEISYFSPSGSQVLEGKAVAVDRDEGADSASSATGATSTTLYFGRAGGGFNNPTDYELFSFNISENPQATSSSHYRDIPGGVYGIETYKNYLFLASHDVSAPIQIWKSDLSRRVYVLSTSVMPALATPGASTLICDHSSLYVAFPDNQGFGVVIPH